jgi:hypothetical protein
LGFPERIGPTPRYVTSALFVILDVFIFAITLKGIQHGSLLWPVRHTDREVFRAAHPALFWLVAVLYLGICAWLLYASIAEVLYTLRRSKRR